jgi:hypothetical protein
VVGKVKITDNKREILRLHTKFSLLDTLTPENLDWDRELGFGKARYELSRENEEKIEDEITGTNEELTSEQREIMEKTQALARQVFDPGEKVFDLRKQRVTDMEDNSRVSLPRPLTSGDEANIEMRRNVYKKLEADYVREKSTEKREQPSNLTKSQERGLKSLQKRIKMREVMVLQN